jgi:peptidoglycan/LPS O-acetylase OafA/YrhL
VHPRTPLRSIEGARGIAALAILAFHVGQVDRGTWLQTLTSRFWLGVPLFFVISGFLLFRPFARSALFGRPWPSLGRYARARALRIVPAYWLVLTVAIFQLDPGLWPLTLVAAASAAAGYAWLTRSRPALVVAVALAVAGASTLALFSPGPRRVWYGVSNYLLLFLHAGRPGLVAPTWSLCIEIAFYAVLPLIAVAAAAWARGADGPSERGARLALALLLTIPVGAAYFFAVGTSGTFMGRWPAGLPGCIDEFGIGMMLAVAIELRPRIGADTSRLLLSAAVAIAIVANVACAVSPNHPYEGTAAYALSRLMTVSFALIFASILMRDERTAAGATIGSNACVAAGTISYGIFLWHWLFVVQLPRPQFWWSPVVDLLLVLLPTLVVAIASWFLLEQPMLRLKDGPRIAGARAARRRLFGRAAPDATVARSVAE